MYFAGYNDYELIYLVNEGSERALNVLYQKYNIYIYKVAGKYIPRGDKRFDLVQEGLMILNTSIKRFNPRFTISFYSYFSILLNRAFCRLIRGSYYSVNHYVDEASVYEAPSSGYKSFDANMMKRYFEDELDLNIYDECILGNLTITSFSEFYNIDYRKVYNRRKAILLRIKNILTNL